MKALSRVLRWDGEGNASEERGLKLEKSPRRDREEGEILGKYLLKSHQFDRFFLNP